jgi:TolB-like protein
MTSDAVFAHATPEEVREALERVLASETFSGAGRHCRLLRYLVERTLAGAGDQLKEYVLGVEVFDRADSYDPRIDSIVRVEARRLRARLEEYYAGPGAGDPIRIVIPRGGYAPTFTTTSDTSPSVTSHAVTAATPAAQGVPTSRSLTMLIVATVLMVLVIGAISRIGPARSPAQASTGPAIAVLPLQHFSSAEADALMAARLTDAVATELARLRTLAVASRTSTAQYSSATRSIADIRAALNVDFVLEGSAIRENDAMKVTVRVVDAARDRKVWVGEYSTAVTGVEVLARQIAHEASEGTLNYHARNAPAER